MVESKGWKWEIVEDDKSNIWKNPSVESYYLLNRWKTQGKTEFLDLGCGLGRHSILFGKNGFHVHCFDISEEAISRTKEWAKANGCQEFASDCEIDNAGSICFHKAMNFTEVNRIICFTKVL